MGSRTVSTKKKGGRKYLKLIPAEHLICTQRLTVCFILMGDSGRSFMTEGSNCDPLSGVSQDIFNSQFMQFMAMEVSLAMGVLNNSNTLSDTASSSAAAARLAKGLI